MTQKVVEMVHVNVGKAGVKAKGIDKETQSPFVRKQYNIRFDLEPVFQLYYWCYLNIQKYSFQKYVLQKI